MPVAAVVEDAREVGVRQRVAERQLAVEVLLILGVARLERDDDVGEVALRPDPALGVGLAAVELGEHLVGRVAAPRAVALHLPVAAQVLRRVEVDAHVEDVRRSRLWNAEQALGDHEARRGTSSRAARTCRRCAGRRAS